MADRPKFRRRRGRTPERTEDDDLRPVPPLETRAERLERREAERRTDDRREFDRGETDRRTAERRAADPDPAPAVAKAPEAASPGAIETPAPSTADAAHAPAHATTRAVAHDAQDTARQTLPAADDPERLWASMPSFAVDDRALERNRIISASRSDPAHVSFDVLRTRILRALSDRQWRRVAVTSPTPGCGKTFTLANLAISLSRQADLRSVVLDLDMRRPELHRVFGIKSPKSIGDMLRGKTLPEQHLLRLGPNDFHAGRSIAFGFNGTPEPFAAELLQDPKTAIALDMIEARLKPDVMLFDLPPALSGDDVLALRPHFDAVLLVVGGGVSAQSDVREAEQRLGADTPLLGVVLNRAEGINEKKYAY
ncbi:Tyrosine-protein kinase YwqD [Roseivivax jejudonensis]|uniref:Tyrosine-protein kinase YwqD n=1 Tax=Roseivivax jejudonensis TaxID=1529041 RepID=A0A1X6YIC0_9RHOB|nr:CpsD/CapB family tyrosine-protein kinase [Roseivivax jejudonensis]SLN22438.1 Tyrosine-protein kinase YwqD [Roseivivax jejudonensis]